MTDCKADSFWRAHMEKYWTCLYSIFREDYKRWRRAEMFRARGGRTTSTAGQNNGDG